LTEVAILVGRTFYRVNVATGAVVPTLRPQYRITAVDERLIGGIVAGRRIRSATVLRSRGLGQGRYE
jgi:hypothetical protein